MSLALIFAACNPLEEKPSLVAPSDVKVEQTSLTTVRLLWNNNSTSYDGVILERANQTAGESFAELARLGNGVLLDGGHGRRQHQCLEFGEAIEHFLADGIVLCGERACVCLTTGHDAHSIKVETYHRSG